MDSQGQAVVNDEIYVIGGFDNISNRLAVVKKNHPNNHTPDHRYLSSVEKYNPERGRWSKLWGMSLPRRSPGVVAYRDRLYVVGGIFLTALILHIFNQGGRDGGEGGLEHRGDLLPVQQRVEQDEQAYDRGQRLVQRLPG